MATNDDLRRRAEGMVPEKATSAPESLETLSSEEIQQTFHELRVHQIELEMQNEELRHAQAELDASRARYFDLYDLAPVGYFTLSEKGLILEANLTATTLLGVAQGRLINRPLPRLILTEDQDIYYRHCKQLFETGTPQVCELRMLREDAAPFWARLEATAAKDADGTPVSRVVMSDITERKQAEEALRQHAAELAAHNELLTRFNLAATGRELRMIELKREINELCRQSGQPPRYSLAFADATMPDATADGAKQ